MKQQHKKLTGSIHVAAIAAALAFTGPSFAVTYYQIYPGQQAVINFHFNGPTATENVVPDGLALLIGGNTPWGLTPTTYSLFDGDTLLGSVRRPGDGDNGQAFRSFDNQFNSFLYIPSVPVDFSSIRSGAIQGRLFYAPEFTDPTPGAHATIEFELYLWKQLSEQGGIGTLQPIVDSVQIIPIPEPTAPVLSMVGLAVAVLASCRGTEGATTPGGRQDYPAVKKLMTED